MGQGDCPTNCSALLQCSSLVWVSLLVTSVTQIASLCHMVQYKLPIYTFYVCAYAFSKFTPFTHLFRTAFQSTPQHRCKCQELCSSLHFDRGWYKLLRGSEVCGSHWTIKQKYYWIEHTIALSTRWKILTYQHIEAHSHSTVHSTGKFYWLIPAVCSLHHRCRSLQSCRLYWRDCVGHLWEYQDHHSQWLEQVKHYANNNITKV